MEIIDNWLLWRRVSEAEPKSIERSPAEGWLNELITDRLAGCRMSECRDGAKSAQRGEVEREIAFVIISRRRKLDNFEPGCLLIIPHLIISAPRYDPIHLNFFCRCHWAAHGSFAIIKWMIIIRFIYRINFIYLGWEWWFVACFQNQNRFYRLFVFAFLFRSLYFISITIPNESRFDYPEINEI